ncbi:MAG: hypothetical protein ABIS20_24255 [Thermoanaerobaculia bacterium]
MSKQCVWAGLLLTVALSFARPTLAVEPLAGGAMPPAKPAADCQAVTSELPKPPVWLQAGPTPCGAGCPLSGQGTSPSCTGKITGDACGVGGTCFLVLTPSCPRSAARCSCITK